MKDVHLLVKVNDGEHELAEVVGGFGFSETAAGANNVNERLKSTKLTDGNA